jgi:hypothetical protein
MDLDRMIGFRPPVDLAQVAFQMGGAKLSN